MNKLSLEKVGLDVDWFAVDPTGKIAHFASGGGYVPKYVEDDAKYDIVFDYFTSLLKINDVPEFNPNLSEYMKRSYPVFNEMAERGLFSFDKLTHTMVGPEYFLYAYPKVCLHIDEIPPEVAAILREAPIDYLKAGDMVIDIEQFLLE